ncbi:bifunctional diaminohydroxyphosphoribosylaminopyrimidine deaminase/5-amino-6-(5-phosphoribosylamino)uracil reductase RibD [Anaerobutyricum soehngenii]|uniref:bifunctional diaminohydroxyphosphoribosylaminopyrimidine deaminase/5-amino-6-(5-phosphoribosylamino)uracil reductase RibD n=1 Tax=Anaerobutyricum soehngenii TaxID=105843 RepID=UPI0032BFA224
MPEEKYMRRAIELAKKGSGHVNPNPLVGAVIVRDGEIIGEGYHECYGQLHAERNAIANAKKRGNSLEGSTIYVTLEPCCHYGKTPPCTEAIIEEKIARVVVGSDDPNPLVSGKGFQMLREKGIEVIPHFLKEECDAMNHVFFHYIRTGTPYVAMKYAMTMDGKIACYTGDSKWVTGEESRAHVQTLRNHYKGIMAGIGTVLADDPMLNCRIEGGKDPIRIITDSHLRIPMDSQLVRTAGQQPLIVACLPDADEEKAAQLQEKGVEVLRIPGVTTADITEEQKEVISLPVLMKELGARKIDGILLEGGGQLNESALQAGIVDRIYCYIAPKIFGGAQAKTPVEGQGLTRAADAWQFNRIGMQEFGQDILLEYEKAQELQ